ncbi:MAG: tripartite tricarboxylate transporter substrate binding protein [Betaproteobacteria bacterium]|nr:tripartite tricarboxylate transporter substrate binding protein [Betaproteobacteria bacterium]
MRKALLALFLALAASHAPAQKYPDKPIRLVVPFPAGGAADVYGRIIGARLTEAWGQPVVVENRTGAGGNIAAESVAKAAPDGYTLVMGSVGTHAVNVTLFPKLPYDPVRDFAPIALVAEADALLVVHPSVPATSVPQLVALARARPGSLSFSSAGPGTASHLAGELFKSLAGVDLLHVPYKGNTPAITDLLAGQTSMLFATMPTVLPHVKAGKLRALATCSLERAEATPELPTVSEFLPGFNVGNWVGLFAPAGTPPAIVERLNGEVVRIMQAPEMKARLAAEGARFVPTTPAGFGAYVRAEIARWAPIVRASGARPE